MNTKVCKKCKLSKTTDNFTGSTSTKDRLRNWCKDCFAKYDKTRRKCLNKDYIKGRTLVRYWPNLKPLEAFERYSEILKTQNNLCKICGNPPIENRRLNVDHCHVSKTVRGLLCDECNIGLGKFKDNIEIMNKAVQYLKGSLDEEI